MVIALLDCSLVDESDRHIGSKKVHYTQTCLTPLFDKCDHKNSNIAAKIKRTEAQIASDCD